jgi:hypothetical protein
MLETLDARGFNLYQNFCRATADCFKNLGSTLIKKQNDHLCATFEVSFLGANSCKNLFEHDFVMNLKKKISCEYCVQIIPVKRSKIVVKMAKHQTSVAVLLLALASAIPKASAADGCPEACWEQCFKVCSCNLNTQNHNYYFITKISCPYGTLKMNLKLSQFVRLINYFKAFLLF